MNFLEVPSLLHFFPIFQTKGLFCCREWGLNIKHSQFMACPLQIGKKRQNLNKGNPHLCDYVCNLAIATTDEIT
jgi:hypothetical protein